MKATSSATDDLQPLFDYYDFDCCKFALAFSSEGSKHKMYTTSDAIKCVSTRIVTVRLDRISDSIISRMGKYWSRGFDFVIESYDPALITFPAMRRVIEFIKNKMTSREMIGSVYETYGVQNDPLMFQMKRYGKSRYIPSTIVGEGEDIMQLVAKGTQPERFFDDWVFTALNKMCENVLYMALGSEKDASDMRDMCCRSVDRYRADMMNIRMGPLFAHGGVANIPRTADMTLWAPVTRTWIPRHEINVICGNV